MASKFNSPLLSGLLSLIILLNFIRTASFTIRLRNDFFDGKKADEIQKQIKPRQKSKQTNLASYQLFQNKRVWYDAFQLLDLNSRRIFPPVDRFQSCEQIVLKIDSWIFWFLSQPT